MTSSDVHVENWSEIKLGNALPISYGKALRSDARDSSGPFPVFGSAGKIGLHSSPLTSGPTLVIGRKGSAGAVHYSPEPCWVIDTAYFSEATDLLDLKFAYYLLQHSRLGTLDRSTAVPSLGRDDYNAVSICIPNKPEQRGIVDKIEELFSDLDAGVAALERARAKLKRYRASVLKAAVEGRLTEKWRAEQKAKGIPVEPAAKLLERILAERRKNWEAAQLKKFADFGKAPPKGWQGRYPEPVQPDLGDLPALPHSWCWVTLDMLAEIASGVAKGSKYKLGTNLTEVPYLRVANVQRGYLDLSEIKTIRVTEREVGELSLIEGDILFNEGGDLDKLGRGWVWNGEIAKCIHQNHVFRARPFSGVQSKFVSFHGNSFGQKWFFRTGKRSVNLASINMGVLRRFPVPLPPAAEQIEIVAQIDATLSSIVHAESEIEHSLARAARLRQGILKRAFEGRLV